MKQRLKMRESKYFTLCSITVALSFALTGQAQAEPIKIAKGSYSCIERLAPGRAHSADTVPKKAAVELSEIPLSPQSEKSLVYVVIDLFSHPKKIKVEGNSSITTHTVEGDPTKRIHIYNIQTVTPYVVTEKLAFHIISDHPDVVTLVADAPYNCKRSN